MKIQKEILEIHQRLNDVKGTERKFIFFNSKDLLIEGSNYIVNEFVSLNWLYEDFFLPISSSEKVEFSKFKYLCYGKKTSELREVENSWKEILNNSIGKESFIYVAYYIGGNKEMIVGEVGKLTKSQFDKIKK